MATRRIEVEFDTSQLDGQYAQLEWVQSIQDQVDYDYYRKSEVDCMLNDLTESIEAKSVSGYSITDRITTLENDVSFQRSDLTIKVSELHTNLEYALSQIKELKAMLDKKPVEDENPFYALIEQVYKK